MNPTLYGSRLLGWPWLILVAAALILVVVEIIRALAGREEIVSQGGAERIGMYSILGTREHQEDAAGCWKVVTADGKTAYAAIVCDGMGGMQSGARASGYCRDNFSLLVRNLPMESEIPAFLLKTARDFDDAVSAFRAEGGKIRSGTTLVAALVVENRLYTVSVGDSRIYLYGNTGIRLVTRDHNYRLRLEEKVKQGKMTAKEADSDKKRESLISFIGRGNTELIDVTNVPIQLEKGDMVLLCSDGVTRLLSEYELQAIMGKMASRSAGRIAEEIVSRAELTRHPSQDNTTAAIIKC